MERTTGEAIADKLTEILLLAIPIKKMRGQAYDGASAMASEKRGCQGRIKSLNQLALFTHCRSHVHVLNLSIASACKLPLVRNMIDVLNSVFIFFDSSPIRQRFLETSIENESVDFSRKELDSVRQGGLSVMSALMCFTVCTSASLNVCRTFSIKTLMKVPMKNGLGTNKLN